LIRVDLQLRAHHLQNNVLARITDVLAHISWFQLRFIRTKLAKNGFIADKENHWT
jgi:hypothetical protein